MRILFVTSECHPLIKTGGLADVSAALPAALAERGIDIRVMMPGYPDALDRADHVGPAIPLGDLPGEDRARLLLARSPDSGMPLWLVDCPRLYRRKGGPYQDLDGRDWPDNDLRFAALCHAAARDAAGLGWRPELIHTNDWHTGLVPLLLADSARSRPPVVFTIHNLAFQGLFAADGLPRLDITADTFSPEGIEFYGRLSFLKAGLRHADRLTTVSRSYAREIQTPEFGCGLDGLLRQRSRHLLGIPNGADYDLRDPAEDPSLPRRYSLAEIGGKRGCKEVLQCELGLDVEPETPVFAFLSRLTEQKMADTVAEAVPWLMAPGAQFALHGQGDRALEERFRALAEQYPGRVSVRVSYEERSARRLLAGADILLHPSRFEPFGLVPIYALRYGTLPLVRKVGGLADSVVDGSTPNIDGEATGFAFSGDTPRRPAGLPETGPRHVPAAGGVAPDAASRDAAGFRLARTGRRISQALSDAHRISRRAGLRRAGVRAWPVVRPELPAISPVDASTHSEGVKLLPTHTRRHIMSDDLNAKIRERAYAIWERENRPEGKHLDHWLCAQAEIEAEQSSVEDQPASVQTDSIDATESAFEGGGRAKKRSS